MAAPPSAGQPFPGQPPVPPPFSPVRPPLPPPAGPVAQPGVGPYAGPTGAYQGQPVVGPYAGPTGAYQQQVGVGPYADENVVIDVGRSDARHFIVGSLIGAIFGGPLVVGAVLALATGEFHVGVIIMLIVGLPLLAIPVITILGAKVFFRPRHLVFEKPGLRWADPRGVPWAMPWSELESVLVHGAVSSDSGKTREAAVSLHLYPVDESHAARHPEMAPHWNTDGDRGVYRVRVSISKNHIPRIDAAMKRFAPGLYAGVAFSEGGKIIPLDNRYPGVLEAGPGNHPGGSE